MKPNKWQKTVFVWNSNLGLETNIPVDDLPDTKEVMHTVDGMRVVSITDEEETEARVAIFTFKMFRGCVSPTTRKEEILGKLASIQDSEKSNVRVSMSTYGSDFKITFTLRNSFCKEVVEFMRKFFTVLGIKDTEDYWLSNFKIESTAMHRQGEGWIPFEQYFKMKERLYLPDLDVEIMPTTAPLS